VVSDLSLEHPFLMKLAEQGVKIVSIDYKDEAEAANAGLVQER